MKYCPSCKTQYTDETLRFCLQDGAPLTDMAAARPSDSTSTGDEYSDNEAETLQRPPRGKQESYEPAGWQQADGPGAHPARASNSRVASALFLSAIALFLVALVGAIGLYLYFKGPGETAKNAGNDIAVPPANNSNRPSPAKPTVTPSPSQQNRGNELPATPEPPADKDQASREVSALIDQWKSDTEAGDLDAQLGSYASTVNYYQKRGASRDFVRADKQRAFRVFDSISIDISNMDVSVFESGQAATAIFDKEWVFDGERRSMGKVRQQIDLRRISGKWLITGERDLRVYYTN